MPPPSLQPSPPDAPTAILAIDTTAAHCSVALARGSVIAGHSVPTVHGHSQWVLRLVRRVIGEAAASPGAIAAIGFGAGPGSFTGLRVACGVAQGLGFGWGCPLVPVDAMRTLALQAAGEKAPDVSAGAVCVALDVRMGEVCHAVFAPGAFSSDRWPEPIAATRLGTPAEALERFRSFESLGVLLAGDGFDVHRELGLWAGGLDPARRRAAAVQPDASAVARLAAIGLRLGRAIDPAEAAPAYLRDKVALDVNEQAARRTAGA